MIFITVISDIIDRTYISDNSNSRDTFTKHIYIIGNSDSIEHFYTTQFCKRSCSSECSEISVISTLSSLIIIFLTIYIKRVALTFL